jgi:hypothetical protein
VCVLRLVIIVVLAYAAFFAAWSRIVSQRRITAASPALRSRLLKWDDRIYRPISIVTSPIFLFVVFVIVPGVTRLQTLWMDVTRRREGDDSPKNPVHPKS